MHIRSTFLILTLWLTLKNPRIFNESIYLFSDFYGRALRHTCDIWRPISMRVV